VAGAAMPIVPLLGFLLGFLPIFDLIPHNLAKFLKVFSLIFLKKY
jgi:hypothetical protein